MALLLIRHGETPLNAVRVMQPPDTPLSERGIEQARLLAARLAPLEVGRILTSDLTRAAMTAEPLAARTGAPLETEPLLRERDFGALRGRPYADFDFDPFAQGYVPPGGESWEVFHARVRRAWRRVVACARETEGHIAVVTHGLVCHSVVERLARLAPGLSRPKSSWRNSSLTILEREPPHTVSLINCAAHLEGDAEEVGRAGEPGLA